ncbi:MAG: hypothetical protein SFT92_03905 [Rickettsiales bacterium]|nr:hypothetical protein [Rickettsiales bacterium]
MSDLPTRDKKKSLTIKNYTLLAILFVLIALFYAITLIKMGVTGASS